MDNRTPSGKVRQKRSERTFEFGLLVAFDAELGDSFDEFFEVDFAVPVLIEQVNDSLHQRILLQVIYLHKFFFAQSARVIDVELLETFAKSLNLFRVN